MTVTDASGNARNARNGKGAANVENPGAGEAADAGEAAEVPRPRSFYDVPGWFYNGDLVLFDWFLSRQQRRGHPGDLLEMGAYLGKSAIFAAGYLREEETFTVCDLFDSEAPDARNGAETRRSYATLTRRAFEANYLSFHDELPTLLQAPTSVVPAEVAAGSCRFVHIDASHLYPHVRGDIEAARQVLTEDGVVVLDDYRSDHTPGVACATWEAVLNGGLRPICVSGNKFYGTWSDPEEVRTELHRALRERGDCWLQTQEVAGRQLLLVGGRKAKPPVLPVSRHASEGATGQRATADQQAAGGAGGQRRGRSRMRRIAVDWLPPVVTRAVLRARRR